MDTKLTLKLDEGIIEKAKEYAREKKVSLSSLIENYLEKMISDKEDKKRITPLVKSLSGIIELPENYDHKKDYTSHLLKKYK